MRRALAIEEKVFGPEHPNVAINLNNLGWLLKITDRLGEAKILMRRALAIDEKSWGSDHPSVARNLNNLALLLLNTNRLADAEHLMRRSLAIEEASRGSDQPGANSLNNLAQMLKASNRAAEAEPLFQRALAINEKALGREHPNIVFPLNNLAWLFADRADWSSRLAFFRRAHAVLIGRSDHIGDRTGLRKAATLVTSGRTTVFRGHARAAYEAGAGDTAVREEGYIVAQRALRTEAAEALSQMSVRFGAVTGPLAGLVRERQDLLAARQATDKHLLGHGGADRNSEALKEEIARFDEANLDAIDARCKGSFPTISHSLVPSPSHCRHASASFTGRGASSVPRYVGGRQIIRRPACLGDHQDRCALV